VGGANISPAAVVEALRNDVYITLAQYYGGVQERVYYVLRDGILRGAPARDIIQDLYRECDDEMDMSRAATLVNTTLARAYEEARHSVYGELETADLNDPEPGVVIGYESVAVMDDVTTPECAERDGLFFTVAEAAADPIPRHYNCRSTYIPIFSGEEPWSDRGWWDGTPLTAPGFQQKGA
jgi:SPP1 gp7 family putative phage head morphogenesis protein